MSVVALVPAAGAGTRLSATQRKALVPLCGTPLVVRAVQGLLRSAVVDAVVVAAPADAVAKARELLAGLGDLAAVVVGGADRMSSVRAALDEAQRRHPEVEIVLVHDAARALTPVEVIRDVVAAVRAGAPAVVPALPLVDTVKAVDAAGRVVGTPDRRTLRTVQTPQGFAVGVLRRAYTAAASASPSAAVTDDAGLVEALGEPVLTTPGHPLAFKITTPWDLQLAERLLAP